MKNDKANYRGLIFLSDHGNEVGHVKNFAGHSPTTEAGFKIPIIMWDSANHLPTGVFRQPIDATQLDANLLHLMGLRHNGNKSAPLWTDKAYSFTIPNYWRQ